MGGVLSEVGFGWLDFHLETLSSALGGLGSPWLLAFLSPDEGTGWNPWFESQIR